VRLHLLSSKLLHPHRLQSEYSDQQTKLRKEDFPGAEVFARTIGQRRPMLLMTFLSQQTAASLVQAETQWDLRHYGESVHLLSRRRAPRRRFR
jgi:hypothetical protein